MFKKLEERTNILRKETEYIERPTVYEMKKYTGWNKKQIGHQRKNSWTWEQSSSKLFKMKQRDKKDKENEHQLALGQNINVKYKYKCKNIKYKCDCRRVRQKIYEEKMTPNFPNLMKILNLQIQES